LAPQSGVNRGQKGANVACCNLSGLNLLLGQIRGELKRAANSIPRDVRSFLFTPIFKNAIIKIYAP